MREPLFDDAKLSDQGLAELRAAYEGDLALAHWLDRVGQAILEGGGTTPKLVFRSAMTIRRIARQADLEPAGEAG